MNLRLAAIAAGRGGWFSRSDALSAGYSDSDLRSRVADGTWLRLCRGAYAEPGPDQPTNPWERTVWWHGRAAKAVYERLGGRAVISHQSALVLHGLGLAGLDLDRIHLTRAAGLGRSDLTVCQHAARPPVDDPVTLDRVRLTSVPRAVVETIRSSPYAVSVSIVDAALHRGLVDREQLWFTLRLFGRRGGVRSAARAISFGNGLAESPGESRLRVLLADLGLPEPLLQAEIRDSAGRFVGRVDLLLIRWNLVLEFDGKVKYTADGVDALIAEKAREDRLRDLGYQVVRITWADLDRPTDLVGRLNRAIDRAARSGPVAGSVTAGRLWQASDDKRG